jgi:DNA invertase Pin-like site-specific DNA recombinase
LPALPAFAAGHVGAVRAAVLVRLSDLTDATTSPERQRSDCADLIAAKGWSYDPERDTFEDLDVSGWRPGVHRPGLEEFMSRRHEYDAVVFWKLDRVFRSVPAFLRFVQDCEAAKVGLVSVKEQAFDTTTPWGRFFAIMLMAIAEIESSNISLRVRSSIEYLVKKGLYRGGRRPFGWRKIPITLPDGRIRSRLGLDPDRAPVVRSMVDAAIAGESLNQIASELNERGISTGTSKPDRNGRARIWKHQSVYTVLRNPVLLGHTVYDGEVVTDDRGVPLEAHEPLTDYWTWQRLQEALDERSTKGLPPRRQDERLLSGLVYCGRCGARMCSHGDGFTCETAALDKGRCASMNTIRSLRLEEYMLDWLFEYLSPDRLAEARRVRAQERELLAMGDPHEQRRREIAEELDRIEADRRHGLYETRTSRERYRAQHRRLTAELDGLENKIARLSVSVELDGRPVEELWNELDQTRRKTLLTSVIERIDIAPTRPSGPRFDPSRINIIPRSLR